MHVRDEKLYAAFTDLGKSYNRIDREICHFIGRQVCEGG